MKKVDVIVTVICLLLIAAALVGMFALNRNIDDAFADESGSDITSSSGSSGANNGFVASDFYIDETNKTGYRTINGKTYFFKILECTGIEDKHEMIFCANKYSDYQVKVCASIDTINWEFKATSNDGEYAYTGSTGCNNTALSVSYITYTIVDACTDPRYVLSDLNVNVFSNQSMFKTFESIGLG